MVSALLGVLLVAGCAAPQVQDSPENIVRQRAKARWDALIAGDWEKAYQFLQPAYREVRDFKSYRSTFPLGRVQWTGADVVGVECKADVCSATIRVDYKLVRSMGMPGGAFNTHYDEKWVTEQGGWWLYEKP